MKVVIINETLLFFTTVMILKSGKIYSCLLTVCPIVTYSSRVSRAPPHHIFPAFQNLHGTFILSGGFLCYSNFTNDNGTDYEDLCLNSTNCDNRNG